MEFESPNSIEVSGERVIAGKGQSEQVRWYRHTSSLERTLPAVFQERIPYWGQYDNHEASSESIGSGLSLGYGTCILRRVIAGLFTRTGDSFLSRRSFVSLGLCAVSSVSAGCVSASLGTVDLVVRNCTEDNHEVTIRISSGSSEEPQFEETVTVPKETCGERDGIEREDVFTEQGTYTIVVSVEGYEPVEHQRKFSKKEIDDNIDSVTVAVQTDTVEIW